MKKGLVTKAYCGYFLVQEDSFVYRCKARGKVGVHNVYVGDYVDFSVQNETEGMIESIYPRNHEINKPPVANISQIILVFSYDEPKLDLLVLDKFLLMGESLNLPVVICVNKIDLKREVNKEVVYELEEYERLGYKVIFTSADQKEGMADFLEVLKGEISVLVGLSGVGKSSLLNAINNELNLKVSSVSEKIKRGKHTTRFVELIEVYRGAWVVDTPGFSFLKHDIGSKDLAGHYPEMSTFKGACKFSDCLHLHEPGCKVKEEVEAGNIAEFRYKSYKYILDELLEEERNKYR